MSGDVRSGVESRRDTGDRLDDGDDRHRSELDGGGGAGGRTRSGEETGRGGRRRTVPGEGEQDEDIVDSGRGVQKG